MTKDLLLTSKVNPSIEDKVRNSADTLYLGDFYEHIFDTSGVVYRKENLETFVEKFYMDPTMLEQDRIQPDTYWLEQERIYSINIPVPLEKNKIIKNNYLLYQVYKDTK